MPIYAIGDVQGCYDDLQRLLAKLQFDPTHDTLWFCGDLVNRGPQSLEVLRFVKSLGDCAISVLGNHDLHLLALDAGVKKDKDGSLQAILDAADRQELITWLRHRPLLHYDQQHNMMLVHAGLAPQWEPQQAQQYAQELESVLQSDHYQDFLHVMYGDQPDMWSDQLDGWDRLRFICNSFTRIRFCSPDGKLVLSEKGAPDQQKARYLPWFELEQRQHHNVTILFGHWSTLGTYSAPGLYALDSGCVWGGRLSALRIDKDTIAYQHIDCPGAQNPLDFIEQK